MLKALLLGVALTVQVAIPTFAQSSSQASTLAPAGPIRAGDVIRLRIWREPDLSGEFPVDLDGKVVLPKIGEVPASVMSADSLRRQIERAYEVYLRNPSIEVIVLRRINVLGAVKLPGLYPVDPTMTLSDVIALAGGATPLGVPDQAQLIRDGKTLNTVVTKDVHIGDLPLRSGDQLYIPERGWVTRNSGVVAAALTGAVSLMIAFLRH